MPNKVDEFSKIILDYSLASKSQIFGQNLFKPSYISGLGKMLVDTSGLKPLHNDWFDSVNCENTSVGYGIGRAVASKNTVLIVKQQDFLFQLYTKRDYIVWYTPQTL